MPTASSSDEAWSVGHRDRVERLPADARARERVAHDRACVAEVIARSELGDDAAVRRMDGDRAVDDVREHAPVVVDHRRSRLVARRLDP